VLFFLSFCTFLGSFEVAIAYFSFDRFLFLGGDYWRPFSAWLTQLNLRHWLLNQWGLVVMVVLLPRTLDQNHWIGFALIWLLSSLSLACSEYDNYVGLSGVLYGWLIYAAVISPFYSTAIKSIFIASLTIKVFSENGYLPLPESNWVGDFIHGQVAHESHFWGLMSGYLVLSMRWFYLLFLKKPVRRD